jgi:hypothetical protein
MSRQHTHSPLVLSALLLAMPLVVLLVMLLFLPLLAAAASPAVDDGPNASSSNAVDNLGAERVVPALHQADLASGT